MQNVLHVHFLNEHLRDHKFIGKLCNPDVHQDELMHHWINVKLLSDTNPRKCPENWVQTFSWICLSHLRKAAGDCAGQTCTRQQEHFCNIHCRTKVEGRKILTLNQSDKSCCTVQDMTSNHYCGKHSVFVYSISTTASALLIQTSQIPLSFRLDIFVRVL